MIMAKNVITCWLDIEPPKVTAQEKQVTFRGRRPIFYEPARLKQAKHILTTELLKFAPFKPIEKACKLTAVWIFAAPKSKKCKELSFKATKPDTDNLDKLLKDCMTKTGYWQDDALCVVEHIEKRLSKKIRGILLKIEEIEDDDISGR